MNTAVEDSATTPRIAPVRALIILVLGLLGAWLAAGSLGWLAPPLQKTLTWIALAAIVLAALPGRRRISGNDGLLLGGATLIAVLMTASSLPVVNVLAVAIMLAAIAQVRPGRVAQVVGPAALAATALAVFRLVSAGSAATWTFTNTLGHVEGLWAGWLTGQPLLIGASFGGVDFLVVMAALTAAWLIATPRPRIGRAAWAMLFIVLAQSGYLVVLAFSHDLSELLPPQLAAKQNEISHLGIWTWGNAIRTLLPWNLPVLAAVFHCVVAVAMFRLTIWQPTPQDRPIATDETSSVASGKRRNRVLQGGSPRPQGGLNSPMDWRRFGPAGLMIVAAVAITLAPVKPDLQGRRIVAYDDGATDWSTSDTGTVPRYGMLPALVESLGGEFIRSRDLADADLQNADVLIVLPPQSAANSAAAGALAKAPIPDDIRDQIWRYVSAGGRMLVAGEPERNLGVEENVLNALLEPTKLSFRDDTANSLTQRWEDNLQSAPHAATASSNPGRDQFSLDRVASIRVSWPAGPLIVGRWAWDELGTDPDRPEALSYLPGERLGDLVLAAQQNVGRGTVVVLGAAGCVSNDGIPFSYTFTGPLLSALAANHWTPLAWWRQLLGLAAAGAAIVLLFRRFEPLRVAAASIALALATIACNRLSSATPELLPSGTKTAARPIIYVDGSHLEAMGKDPRGENGIGRFMRVLASNGYLPLVAPDLSPERLNRAAMLISIAPGKAFSRGEIAAVDEFVKQGGFFLSMVGSPEAEPSRALLEQLQLRIDPTPVPPWVPTPETEPLGRYYYPNKQQPFVQFYAAWPVSSEPREVTWPEDDPKGRAVIAGHRVGRGQAFILGDSAFALKKNFDSFPQNAAFWRSQLKTWIGHSADQTQAVDPRESGIINLPKPQSGTGATP
ncbi:MAG: hypothetical protein ABSG53_13985 [Thermoguttaceae bacterium]